MKILEFDAVNASSHPVRRFFKLRLLASVLSFAGFWFCAGRARQIWLAGSAAGGESGGFSLFSQHAAIAYSPAGGVPSPPPGDPTAIAPPAPVVVPSVVIDAGHGGADGGTPAGGMVETILSNGVVTQLPKLPIELSGARPDKRMDPPQLGAHSRDVLREAGLSDEEIDALVRDKVVASRE